MYGNTYEFLEDVRTIFDFAKRADLSENRYSEDIGHLQLIYNKWMQRYDLPEVSIFNDSHKSSSKEMSGIEFLNSEHEEFEQPISESQSENTPSGMIVETEEKTNQKEVVKETALVPATEPLQLINIKVDQQSDDSFDFS